MITAEAGKDRGEQSGDVHAAEDDGGIEQKGPPVKASKYRGVTIDRTSSKQWKMRIQKDGKMITKRFETELEAAHAYDVFATECFGDAAQLNFPDSDADAHNTELYAEPAPKTSKYRGVAKEPWGKWRMQLRHNKERYSSFHETQEEAAHAYDVQAYMLRGDKAILNFPELKAETAELAAEIAAVVAEQQ